MLPLQQLVNKTYNFLTYIDKANNYNILCLISIYLSNETQEEGKR
jgi:hypothetical protein